MSYQRHTKEKYFTVTTLLPGKKQGKESYCDTRTLTTPAL